jgi:hypothetical protein
MAGNSKAEQAGPGQREQAEAERQRSIGEPLNDDHAESGTGGAAENAQHPAR